MKHATIDFETKPIVPGSPRSPEPVGVAVRADGRSRYFGWGHPNENNSTRMKAGFELQRLCREYSLIMHNAQFDLRVLLEHFKLWPAHPFHDTKVLAFLKMPNHWTLSLKPLSEELLGWVSVERDHMHDWLRANYLPARRVKDATKFTAYAPGDIVRWYAEGDVNRTWRLYQKLIKTLDEGERQAYERELAVIKPTIHMEQRGVRIDVKRLSIDLELAMFDRAVLKGRLENRLRAPGINLGSTKQLVEALEEQQMCDEFILTDKGNDSVSIPSLRATCNDQMFVDELEQWSKLGKIIGTYMKPWLESAESNAGYFHPYFNPTRVDAETGGTRTGRFSSNFQQVPKAPFGELPFMRRYVLPDEGHTLIDRDYSQQELRILAHFAGGDLAATYRKKPDLDVHDHVQKIIQHWVPGIDRKTVKICNFLSIYGGGVNRLADQLGIPKGDAQRIKTAHENSLPEVRNLNTRLHLQHRKEGFIRTWGGRKYSLPYDKWYKLINVLIQGSAADQTKEAMVRHHDPDKGGGQLMLQVHDELLVSANYLKGNDEHLRASMEDMPGWDVPMLSDVATGKNWGELK